MIFYDGIYRLRRQDSPSESRPPGQSATYPYAWRLRIIDLSISQPEVQHLRPIIVVASQTEDAVFKVNCAETLGRRICKDFVLDINEILWVEYFPDKPDEVFAAIFTPKSYFGPDIFYTVDWRPILPNELEVIKFFIPETEHINI